MDFFVSIVLVMVASIEIQGKNLDHGPQVLNNTAKLPTQSHPKRYATKEIILYLTPSQIRALQEGRAQINPQNIPHADNEKQAYAHAQALAAHHEHSENPHQHLAHPQPLKVPPVEEPHSDHFVPIIPPPQYRQSDNFAYINFHPQHQQHIPNIPKSVPFLPEAHEPVAHNGHIGLPSLIPHEPHHNSNLANPLLRENLKDQWNRLLDQNRAHLNAFAALSQYNTERDEHKKDLLQYAPKYNDHKYALDIEHLISNHQLELEKQRAQLQAEAIANSPPVIVHKEISIKHSPVHLIKQVKVPVPTPVLIPVPEPFEVKVPQPYPVPFEIIKPVPVPIVKTQKIEIDRPVPIEVEKHVPFPVSKNVFVNIQRPHYVDRLVPLEIPVHKDHNLPSHHHGWNH